MQAKFCLLPSIQPVLSTAPLWHVCVYACAWLCDFVCVMQTKFEKIHKFVARIWGHFAGSANNSICCNLKCKCSRLRRCSIQAAGQPHTLTHTHTHVLYITYRLVIMKRRQSEGGGDRWIIELRLPLWQLIAWYYAGKEGEVVQTESQRKGE